MPAETPSGDDSTTTTGITCPVCWRAFRPIGRQRFCSDNCRKTAWARTRRTPQPVMPVPPPGQRRDSTIYACPSCDTRFHGQQWCHDCNQPCIRIGLGGLCPHCEQPVALSDLFDQPKQAPTG